jgi:hypothetical protein
LTIPKSLKEAILWLIENKEERISMGKNAFSQSHVTSWGNIAIQYNILFDQLTTKEENLNFCFPPIKLDHIKTWTAFVYSNFLNLVNQILNQYT